MTVKNLSFDDSDDESLYVFSGADLVAAYHDQIDLDWGEVTQRTLIDERRGLVILQVAALEDLIDELLMYLADDPDQERFYAKLSKKTIGPRLKELEELLVDHNMMNNETEELLASVTKIVKRRNVLAHGTIHLVPVGGMPTLPLKTDLELEWVIKSRRSPSPQRLTMSQLRDDLYQAIGCFMSLIKYANTLVEYAPQPKYFSGGRYI